MLNSLEESLYIITETSYMLFRIGAQSDFIQIFIFPVYMQSILLVLFFGKIAKNFPKGHK